ncbi:hypothetical protein K469DRAFT_103295 [Zopfia rhizophila CBS 207.26]|uniref:DUF6594 domain-containing protein n=1 Tax=Zopfia rhizophila CBS 207.26 TaxID=1314779 RepID=A0A6A6EAT8_9PEZI|nr:hypothetical protein K469DRAFT_103295 [Zopfia rhizophila CBS 207.26]
MASQVPRPTHQQSQPHSDPNDALAAFAQAYPRLADFFAECPRYLHLRRFSALSVRVLLYRQHELAGLEKELSGLELDAPAKDLGSLKVESGKQRHLYEKIIPELKEYEEALIRFDKLGTKGWDFSQLKTIQRFLAQPEGCGQSLVGTGAHIWGTLCNTRPFERDIIQVVRQTVPSPIVKWLMEHDPLKLFRLWRFITFRSSKKPDVFGQYSHSAQKLENATFSVGNTLIAALIYTSISLLYHTGAGVSNLATVLAFTAVVVVCTSSFSNQQFVVTLATYSAVLVTLLSNNDGKKDCRRS